MMFSKPETYSLSDYAKGIAPEPVEAKETQVTFPDLHGNALGALLRLEACGILELTAEHRQRLSEIYRKSDSKLTDDDVQNFEDILAEAKTPGKDKFECVRFVGDILGDRGKNDLLMLLVLKKLNDSDGISKHYYPGLSKHVGSYP